MVEKQKYLLVERRDRTELLSTFDSDDPASIAEALYSATYHDPDWKWVQGWCLKFLKSNHQQVRWAAATCLGSLSFFHRDLDLDLVVPALTEAAEDPTIAPAVEDSLLDIRQFVKTH